VPAGITWTWGAGPTTRPQNQNSSDGHKMSTAAATPTATTTAATPADWGPQSTAFERK